MSLDLICIKTESELDLAAKKCNEISESSLPLICHLLIDYSGAKIR